MEKLILTAIVNNSKQISMADKKIPKEWLVAEGQASSDEDD